MKVIDLLNKIAKGEIDRLDKFQFSEDDYCSIEEFFYRYVIDEENLNLEIIEDKKIEHINKVYDLTEFRKDYPIVAEMLKDVSKKQYEIIDKINGDSDE